jgi:hypothetical protein
VYGLWRRGPGKYNPCVNFLFIYYYISNFSWLYLMLNGDNYDFHYDFQFTG